MNNIMDQDSIDFLHSVQYITKEEYLRRMKKLRKLWKKDYNNVANTIRSLKLGEKIIGETEIGPRTSYLYWDVLNSHDTTAPQEEINAVSATIKRYVKAAGRLQSLRAALSNSATKMIEDYMEQKSFLKDCAHYSYIIDRMLEETNRRF